MMTVQCPSCGRGVDLARFCPHCGAAIHSEPLSEEGEPEPEAKQEVSRSDIAFWGAIGLAVVAIVAIAAIGIDLMLNDPGGSSTDTTVVAAEDGASTTAPLYPPVVDPITILDPATDAPVQYYRDGVTVNFMIAGRSCTGSGGKIVVEGALRNDSKAEQTLDYEVGIDFLRALTGTRIGHVETKIEGVAPGALAEFHAEKVASQVVTLRCEITDVTVLAAD